MHYRENLEKLREWMRIEKVQAFHIPREDMFRGEYVAVWDERLAWVSGFTGSAGFAIITNDQAHLFVDGRYTLQAKSQAECFTIHALTQLEIEKVCHTLNPLILHYDPWLMSIQQLLIWQGRMKVKALPFNPIDKLWVDRPRPIYAKAFNYPITYAGVTYEEKLKLLYEALAKYNVEACFLSNSESICWLFNIRGNDLPFVPVLHCMALITKSNVTLFCEPKKVSDELIAKLNFKVVPFELMANELKFLKTEILADKRTTPSILYNEDVVFNWQVDPCEIYKAKKNPIEQEGMRNCHIRDAVAVIHFWRWLEQQANVTEMQAQDYLETCRAKMDLHQSASFSTVSAFGAHGAIVHYRSGIETNIAIEKGIYLLDSGGQYLDGTTDITRTFAIGTPTQEQRIHYTLVLKGHIALANIHFPAGTTGAQLDVLARQYLWGYGLDYAHGTGHGVGSYLNVHEGPQGISRVFSTVLEPGMVLSNEPGLYFEGRYGIRIENLQMVKKSIYEGFLCFESLTLVPYETELIEKSLLTQVELDWLESYYQEILKNISPLLSKDEQHWLQGKVKF